MEFVVKLNPAVKEVVERVVEPETVTITMPRDAAEVLLAVCGHTNSHAVPQWSGLYYKLGQALGYEGVRTSPKFYDRIAQLRGDGKAPFLKVLP